MKYLVTGCAGFIGMHVCIKLLKEKNYVVGVDNLNNYYSKKLKFDRLKILKEFKNFKFFKTDISNEKKLKNIFKKNKPNYVVHLAAQAGVRYSVKKPQDYTKSNLVGFANILECSRVIKVKHLIYASSSSVYGDSKKFPLSENLKQNSPISFYGATKLCNELMAHSYSYLFRLPTTGVRFFTVYGPWGRPDMALFLFTDAIKKNKKIKMFNGGKMIRDFTYIDDVVISIKKLIKNTPSNYKKIPYRILNLGSNKPISLKNFIKNLEIVLKKKANKVNYSMQKGDVKHTHASIRKLDKLIKFRPNTNIQKGIFNFVNWYNKYYDKE